MKLNPVFDAALRDGWVPFLLGYFGLALLAAGTVALIQYHEPMQIFAGIMVVLNGVFMLALRRWLQR